MSNATCFDPGTLKSYLLGKLSDEQSDAISAHLEACLNCEATVAELDRASDTLTDGLRQPALAADPATDAELQVALAKVQSLESAAEHRPTSERSSDRSPVLRDYRLLEPLGSGGMGTVYKAVHTRLDRLVAVKLLPARRLGDEQAVARFQREMRVIGQLSHPAIVQATDAGEVDGTHFLVMEFVEGFDLNTIAKTCGPLSIADACEIVRQAALGLEYAHQQGIVHRDIKPSNLMLSKYSDFGGRNSERKATASDSDLRLPNSPFLKILDLGLALLSGEQAPVDELTTVGQLMGTLDYMAPEQLEDSHLVGPRADIYALAATLYRLLTGAAPFAKDDRKTPLQKLRALATQAAPPIRERRADVPEELAAIIDRALARDPVARFPSMSELAAALAPWCLGHDLGEISQRAGQLAQPVSGTGCSLPGSLSPWERAGVRNPRADRLRSRNSSADDRRSGEESRMSERVPHPNPLPEGEGTGRRRSRPILSLLAFLGVAALGIVIAIETNKGTLIVESIRDGVEVRVRQSGKQVEQLELTTGLKSARLMAGEYEIEIVGDADGLQIQNGKFVLKRGDTVVAKITEMPKAVGKKQLDEEIKDQAVESPRLKRLPLFRSDEEIKDQAVESPVVTLPRKPTEIVDRNAKGMETFEASNPDLAAEKKVLEVLLKNTSIDFADTPLTDVLLFLEDRTQLKFHLETEALVEEGIAPDTPVTLSMAGKPTTTVLEFFLRPLLLAWYIDGGQVVVTTAAKEMEVLVSRTYPVGKLLPGVRQAVDRLNSEPRPTPAGAAQGGFGGGGGGARGGGGGFYHVGSISPLISTLPEVFGQFGGGGAAPLANSPPAQQAQIGAATYTEASHFQDLLSESLGHAWLDREGEGGTCELLHNVLVVRHTRRAHADVEALLRTVEAAFLKPLTEPAEIRPAGYSLAADANVRRQLARQLDVEFTDTPLTDIAEWLSDQLEVQVWLDREAFAEEGIGTDVPVTLQFQGITGEVLLSRMLRPRLLAHVIEHGVLIFTTASKEKERLVTKVYDVRDLLARGLHPNDPIRGLETTTTGPWQTRDGEGGTITLFADTLLVIRQTSHNHDEVAKCLTSLRSQLGDQPEVPRVIKTRPKTPLAAQPSQPASNEPKPTTTPPAKPTADNQPRYDGKSFDEWLAILDTERSPARLAEALQALRLLHQDHQAATVAQRLLMLFRTVDSSGAYGNSEKRRQLSSDVDELLVALPQKVLETASVEELKNGNARSRKWVFYSVISPQRRRSFDSENLTRAVLQVSRDNDVSVRTAALSWLVQQPVRTWFPNVEAGIKTRFREALSDKTPATALSAVRGLLDSEPDTAAVVEALKRIIGTPTETPGLTEVSHLQGEALNLAAVMGPRAAAAAPAIAPFLLLRDSPNDQAGFAGHVGLSIGQFGGPRAIQLSIQSLAALALARMGKAADTALPTIEEALKQTREAPGVFGLAGGMGFGSVITRRGGGSQAIPFVEFLIAAKARLEDRPAADLKDKPIEVKPEDIVLVQALLRLLETEQVLLEHHYGPGSERPELRELDQKLKAAEEEFNTLQKLFREQLKNSPRKPGALSDPGAKPTP